MALIFLSYAHEDAVRARLVHDALKQMGHRVWWDKDILPGKRIPLEVGVGLADSDALVLVLTGSSVVSPAVKDELSAWHMRHQGVGNLIPIRFDNAELPPDLHLLEPIKYIDGRGDSESVVAALRHLLPPDVASAALPVESLERLELAIDAAVKGGTIAMRYYNSCLSPNRPLDQRRNPDMTADKAAEAEILAAIDHYRRSGDSIITETEAQGGEVPAESGYAWVIDPLDGTNNFTNRIPFFCCAIGILKNGQPHIGVVYDPTAHDLYFAAAGRPTKLWCVERGIVLELARDDTTVELRNSIIGLHISSRQEPAGRLLGGRVLGALAGAARHTRALGSGQLALAYVAAGRLQIFFQFAAHPWDQVAGAVLVRSAGGVVRGYDSGEDWTYGTPDFVASGNAALADAFDAVVGRCSRAAASSIR